jgi:dephospho-CoA kinase
VVLDVPLLLEMGGGRRVDRVVAVSAPASVQRMRLARRRLAPAQIAAFLARQLPDAEVRRRAHLVVPTGLSRHHALRVVARLIEELRRWTVPCCSTPRPPASIRWRVTASSRWRRSNW